MNWLSVSNDDIEIFVCSVVFRYHSARTSEQSAHLSQHCDLVWVQKTSAVQMPPCSDLLTAAQIRVSALLGFFSESLLHSMNKLMTYVIRNNMCWVMQQVVSEMTSMTVWQLFSMDVYNPESRQPLTSDQLYQQLLHIVSQSPSDVTVPIGLLTSQHRDTWFKDFTQLSQGLMLLWFGVSLVFTRLLC